MKISEYAVAFGYDSSLKIALQELAESVVTLLDAGYVPSGSMTHSIRYTDVIDTSHYVCQPMILKKEDI